TKDGNFVYATISTAVYLFFLIDGWIGHKWGEWKKTRIRWYVLYDCYSLMWGPLFMCVLWPLLLIFWWIPTLYSI
ncbi:MAG: hypothetical protein RIF46_02405, partial [Cyclobacteriaceae bacterium]